MKNLRSISIAALAFGLLSGAAFAANPVVKELSLGGTVKTVAIFPSEPTPAEGAQNATMNGGHITITDLADQDLHPQTTTISVEYKNVTMNYKAKIGLYSSNNGLRSDGTPPDGFVNRVNYTAAVAAGDLQYVTLTTGGEDSTKSEVTDALQDPINDGTLTVDINIASDASVRLMEGEYSDTLQLKIGTDL